MILAKVGLWVAGLGGACCLSAKIATLFCDGVIQYYLNVTAATSVLLMALGAMLWAAGAI